MITLRRLDTKYKMGDLRKVELVTPKNAGSRWKGIKHHTLLKELIDVFHAKGIMWKADKAIALSKDKADMACVFEFEWVWKKSNNATASWVFQLGLTTSNARRLPTQFYLGNTQHGTDLVLSRVDIPDFKSDIGAGFDILIKEAISKIQDFPRRTKNMKERVFTEEKFSHTLLDACIQPIRDRMPCSLINTYLEAHSEDVKAFDHASAVGNVMRMVRVYNKIMTRCNPLEQMHRKYKFLELVTARS